MRGRDADSETGKPWPASQGVLRLSIADSSEQSAIVNPQSAIRGIYLHHLRTKFKATKDLDWPDGLCVYGLRHTSATNFIKERPDKIEYLRELLGHKDLQMIREHYGHLFDENSAIHEVLDSLSLPS